MSKFAKVLDRVLRGTSDADLAFGDLCYLLERLEFKERIRGSHHVFVHDGMEEIINVQPRNSKANPYQVKQVRDLLLKYKLGGAH